MKELLFIAFVLACPLMMILMMRGHGHGSRHHHADTSCEPRSVAELRRQRDELDRLIAEREVEEATPDSDRRRSAVSTAAVTDDGGHDGPSR